MNAAPGSLSSKSLGMTCFTVAVLVALSTGVVSVALHAAGQAVPAQTVPPLDADITPLTSKNIAGHRLWIVLFDKSAMRVEDLQRAAADAAAWNAKKTPNVDVVAVAVISSIGIQMLQDFTTNDAKLRQAFAAFAADELDPNATSLNGAGTDLDALASDTRFTGLNTICDALRQWPEKKEMLYFTAGPGPNNGDTQAIQREALRTCDMAHVTIDPVDARGLTASVRASTLGSRGTSNASAGRGIESAAPTRNVNRLPPSVTGFAGNWRLATSSSSSDQSRASLWLGQAFTISYSPAELPTSVSFRAAPPQTLAWAFNLTGSPSVNAGAAPLAGDWVSSLSWAGDTLVLTMTGTVQQNGKPVPAVVQHALTLVTDAGAHKGELRVVTTATPAGLLADGVWTYKKVG